MSSLPIQSPQGVVPGHTSYIEHAQEAAVLACVKPQTTVGGGFLSDADRRWVETRIMVLMAGGIAEQQGQGLTTPPVGSVGDEGLVRDVLDAASLPGERVTYTEWLIARTRTMLVQDGRPWRYVEAVQAALQNGATLDRDAFLVVVYAVP